MDDETKIDSQVKPATASREHHTRQVPAVKYGVSPMRWTVKPSRVKPINGHRTKFWVRMRLIWDWFWLSITLVVCVFSMLAGGLLATKILIMIWEGLLVEHFSK